MVAELELPIPGVAKPRVCKDCPPRPKPLAAPYEGPRCYHHNVAAKRASRLRRHERDNVRVYGMPAGFFPRLLAFQGNRCAICPRRLTAKAQRDHDHTKTGSEAIRGLLCRKCNGYLGHIRDDPVVVARMGRYLRDPPAQQLLMAWTDEGRAT